MEKAFEAGDLKSKILVVEDDETSRMLLGRIIREAGYEAIPASGEDEARKLLETDVFDLVLLDILLEGSSVGHSADNDGYHVLKHIKRDLGLWNLPVIVITGLNTVESAIQCIELGAVDYLVKPFDPSILKARVKSNIERKNLLDREAKYLEKIKEQNLKLAERERYYRGVVEDQTELICRYGVDMHLTFVNGAYCRFFGKDASDLIAQLPFGLDAAALDQEIKQCLEYITQDNPVCEFEVSTVCGDKAKRWLSWTNRALFGDEGEIVGYQAVGRDITERRMMESAIRESELNLNKAQSIANLGYIRMFEDAEGEVWSDQVYRILAYPEGSEISKGRRFLSSVHPDDIELVNNAILDAWDGRSVGAMEFRALRKDGNTIFVSLESEVIVEDSGRKRLEGVIQDITRRKQTERQLLIERDKAEAATKSKEKFISLLSHDLRAPLGSIQGLLEIINDGSLSEAKRFDFTERALDNSRKLLRMLDNLLSLNHIQSGLMRPELVEINARDLAMMAWEKVRPLASKKGIKLENSIDAGQSLNADPSLLEQALINIMHNAIKFSHAGGVIYISSPPDSHECISVKDEGVGITPEDLEMLFDQDRRKSSVGTAGERGSGMGLSIAKDIMKSQGGQITVVSQAGAGTEFLLHFPKDAPTLLIVDDDEDFRLVMRTDLESLNVKILEAASGQEAIDITRKENVSLVITDYDMPNMNGCELVSGLRNEFKSLNVPVILVSVDSNYQTKVEAMRAGASEFFIKPVEKALLLESVRRHIKLPELTH